MVETGPPWQRDILDKTGLAEALFELATVNEEEWWGGILGTCGTSARGWSSAVKCITVGN